MGSKETPDEAPHQPTALQRRIPNALTLARVVMTVAFVGVLSVYSFPDQNAWALPTALVLFVAAALTDAADGYLARKWNAVSVFGRIVDPLADKVLVLGAFIMLAGPGFFVRSATAWGLISGVATWMVVVILARELLVTTLRGALEGRGVDFSAMRSGKLKMIAQSVGVPLILLVTIVAAHPEVVSTMDGSGRPGSPDRFGMLTTMNAVVAWSITLITAASVVPYVTRAMGAMRGSGGGSDG